MQGLRALVWAGLLLISLCLVAAEAATPAAGGGAGATASKRREAVRTREDMILEVEMKALREALETRQDQESSSKFVDKAASESVGAKEEADKARNMLQGATAAQTELESAKQALQAAIEKAKAAAEEAQALADKAKTDSKLAGVEVATFAELRAQMKKEIADSDARLKMAEAQLAQAREKEAYYRALVKRRLKNAEDFYYIADAAMKKGGNAQALEFAVKSKAEMEQAKIAESEAAIRAEATNASEKVVDARKQGVEAAKVKAVALAALLKITEEIAKSLAAAYQTASLSVKAAEQYLAKTKEFAAAKEEIGTFAGKKIESLTSIKDSAEKKEILTNQAAEAAKAVLAAKQKAQAEAEAKAQSTLSEARNMVLGPSQQVPAAQPAAPAPNAKP